MAKRKDEKTGITRCPDCHAIVSTGATHCPSCAAHIVDRDWRIEVSGQDASDVQQVASSLFRQMPSRESGTTPQQDVQSSSDSLLQLFISHSSKDQNLVTAIVNLLRSALNLSADAIRCTSVDGYRLPAGAHTDDQLRDEIASAESFIGIVSSNSMDSTYVIFELGARWAAKKPLIPLLAPKADSALLAGPLAAVNALSCDSPAQLHQLVTDVSAQLKIDPQPAASFQTQIDNIVSQARA